MKNLFRRSCCMMLFIGCVLIATATILTAGEFERNTDRPGSDIRSFDLPRPYPDMCREACDADGSCVAWTYVRPGVQGSSARCWLKNSVPRAVRSDCCVSGVKESAPARRGGGMERNTDRPGSDIQNFNLSRPSPELCRDACDADSSCVAWTYVRPGVQGSSARCWLKNSVPGAVRSDCCVSGVKESAPARRRGGMERNTDRPGSDIQNFNLSRPSPELCRDACDANGSCVAWTYVRPGVQGSSARCWLKNSVPGAVRSDCCVSGVK